jgi:hypothetical protein
MGQLVRGSPGVYLQGLPSEPLLPLTAIAGFAGVAERGPLHVPQPIRNWDEFQVVFGDFIDYGYLAHAVFGFFRNGGSRCFIVRVADLTDYSAENIVGRCPRVDLLRKADSTATAIQDANNEETLVLFAINDGRWGNRLHFEIRPGSQRHLSLTTLSADAASGATTITVAEPFDLEPNMSIRLAPLANPFAGQTAEVQAVTAAGVVTLKAALTAALPRGTAVLGRGFKIVVRLGERVEVFDNLSMTPTHPSYFVAMINGPDESLSYIERQARGHSVLVRAQQVFTGTQSRFRPVPRVPPAPPTPDPNTLSGGGDGFRYSAATFRDAANVASIRIVARTDQKNRDALGTKGNAVRVRAEPFATKTALAAASGDTTVFLENVSGLAVGDSITIESGALTDTRPVTAIGADNKIDFTGGLANPYPRESTVRVADRFTLSVFRDPTSPLFTTVAVDAGAGATTVVVDNAIGISTGTLTLSTQAGTASETYAIVSVAADNVVTLNTGGLVNPYPVGSLVTVSPPSLLAREPVEIHRNLSANPASTRYFRPRLGNDSTYLCGDGPDVVLQPPVGEVTLSGGRDPGNIDFRWYTGYDANGQLFVAPATIDGRGGLATLELIEEVDLVAIPDLAGQTLLPPTGVTGPDALYLLPHRQVLNHAARLGERLALLDVRLGATPDEAARLPRQLADPATGKFGALYYPWLKAVTNVDQRMVPPSGWVAGIIARADRDAGVARAPANFSFRDVVDVDRALEASDQDDLNPAGVNVVRKFELPALEVWGARTLSTDPAAIYVNVRRLVIALKKALAQRLLWAVFEPNGPALRRRIQAALQSLLQTLVAGGATATSDNAFFVKCDDENNPPEIVALGQIVATIGIALAAPAEFIVLNVKRTPDAVSVSEEAQ